MMIRLMPSPQMLAHPPWAPIEMGPELVTLDDAASTSAMGADLTATPVALDQKRMCQAGYMARARPNTSLSRIS